jgi:hypothetical protein
MARRAGRCVDVKRKLKLRPRGGQHLREYWGLRDKLAEAYGHSGALHREIAARGELVAYFPNISLLKNRLRDACKRKDIRLEISALKKRLAEDPWNETLTAQLTEAYWRNGDIPLEVTGWKELVETCPHVWVLRGCLADAARRNGDIDLEIVSGRQFVENDPSSTRLSDKLADTDARAISIMR